MSNRLAQPTKNKRTLTCGTICPIGDCSKKQPILYRFPGSAGANCGLPGRCLRCGSGVFSGSHPGHCLRSCRDG